MDKEREGKERKDKEREGKERERTKRENEGKENDERERERETDRQKEIESGIELNEDKSSIFIVVAKSFGDPSRRTSTASGHPHGARTSAMLTRAVHALRRK